MADWLMRRREVTVQKIMHIYHHMSMHIYAPVPVRNAALLHLHRDEQAVTGHAGGSVTTCESGAFSQAGAYTAATRWNAKRPGMDPESAQ